METNFKRSEYLLKYIGLPEINSRRGQWWGFFSLRHRVQTGAGAHPASYTTGTGSSFPGGKAAGAWGWSLTSI